MEECDPFQTAQAVLLEAREMEGKVIDMASLTAFYNAYLAKKGKAMGLMTLMGKVEKEKKAAYGKAVNEVKSELISFYDQKKEEFEKAELRKKLESEALDITLPGSYPLSGRKNPFYEVLDEIEDVFLSMGYEIDSGRDIETDHYNFELLNVPKDHPSRDMQDTFYFDAEKLLRTQTSAAQAHAMLAREGKSPIKMICPGKTYRRDDDDATHSHQFGQIEGLVVDREVSIANLKATLELFAKKMFGEKREIRMRSSYFPFTEPSVEVDVSCFACGGKGCSLCKNSGWIEILGAGMVNPKVLSMCGYDPEQWSGFAFGVGIERVAMLKYGIDDIRRFYQNDERFLASFSGK